MNHDNEKLIVTDDSCLILINSNNWNKGVSLQQSFSNSHLWTTKSLVFKYAKLSGGTIIAQLRPPADEPEAGGLVSDLPEHTRSSKHSTRLQSSAGLLSVGGLAYEGFNLGHFQQQMIRNIFGRILFAQIFTGCVAVPIWQDLDYFGQLGLYIDIMCSSAPYLSPVIFITKYHHEQSAILQSIILKTNIGRNKKPDCIVNKTLWSDSAWQVVRLSLFLPRYF